MKRFLKRFLIGIFVVYSFICLGFYFYQEKIIFIPTKLPSSYTFQFGEQAVEKEFKTSDGITLNGLLFQCENPKGLIFMCHGNTGSLASIGGVAKTYTNLQYDVFILDYRGYGKSQGDITSEKQIFSDMQLAYNEIKQEYPENELIVLGYSIGTGIAAHLASKNNPKMLILEAPYYSLTDLMRHRYAFLPTFILKYKFETNEYLNEVQAPIVIFHGEEDQAIYYGSSIKLKNTNGERINLIALPNQGHTGFVSNPLYLNKITEILK